MDRTPDSDSGNAGSIPAGVHFDSQIAGGMLYVTPVTYFMAFYTTKGKGWKIRWLLQMLMIN